jgi:hypothetical protein
MRNRKQLQESADREIQAISLRRQGLTYAEIAQQVGYSDHVGAMRAVKRGMQKALQEPADELREIEASRLDLAQAKIWPKVEQGDTKAVMTLIRIMERRAKLLGLDAPTVIQQDVTVFDGAGDLDREVQRLAEFLAGNPNADSGSITHALAIEAGPTGADES